MSSNIIYRGDKAFLKYIREKHYIPILLNHNAKYLPNYKYYSYYFRQFFKVLDVKYKNNMLEQVYIKSDDNLFSLLSTDLDPTSDYKIKVDKNNIHKLTNIVNNNIVLSGAEWCYWFFMNKINCFNEKYGGFFKFVDYYSQCRVQDESFYKLSAAIDNKGNFFNCKCIKVKDQYSKKKNNTGW